MKTKWLVCIAALLALSLFAFAGCAKKTSSTEPTDGVQVKDDSQWAPSKQGSQMDEAALHLGLGHVDGGAAGEHHLLSVLGCDEPGRHHQGNSGNQKSTCGHRRPPSAPFEVPCSYRTP